MILIQEHTPLITDWMIAWGSICGIPLAVCGFFVLFLKDKNKARQLTALEKLAVSQEEIISKMQLQVDQLASQTAQFQYQSHLMVEYNKLTEKQFELQSTAFEHTKEIDKKKQEIEDQKRRDLIKPYFIVEDVFSNASMLSFSISNQGQDAFELKIIPVRFDFINPIVIADNTQVKAKRKLELFTTANVGKTTFTSNQVTFEAKIQFKDCDGNVYEQNLKRQSTGQFKVQDPVLIELAKK